MTTLLARARDRSGLSQEEVARRARTSRTTISAYEHGRKSPTLDTLQRLLAAMGFELEVEPRVTFDTVRGPRGRSFAVPDRLPRLPADQALRRVRLPVHLNWSHPDRWFDLRDRNDRSRVYELVLTEGQPEDILEYVDGLLLADCWDDLVLPHRVRAAWEPIVAGIRS